MFAHFPRQFFFFYLELASFVFAISFIYFIFVSKSYATASTFSNSSNKTEFCKCVIANSFAKSSPILILSSIYRSSFNAPSSFIESSSCVLSPAANKSLSVTDSLPFFSCITSISLLKLSFSHSYTISLISLTTITFAS